eukprot:NODE_4_length_5613_cov_10.585550_g3_i0.p1 GENE.NODE_4_length_5613_cov_10.585550_g3_i0~~NODE_4_length_5613_cov_10.585550_g3_i0.p1  ORF type:complete len:551 (+),score=151.94 NODE_4_length_5613_cov_10.585550_g3_i0:877-2529(+)
MVGLIDIHGAPLRADPPRANARLGGAAYEAASATASSHGKWRPKRHAPQHALARERGAIVARTEDGDRNNPWAVAGLDRKLEMVIGKGWTFTSTPDAKALGITPKQAKELGDQIEAWIAAYCSDSELRNDAAMRESVAMQMGSAFRHCLVSGDAFGIIRYLDRGGECHTALELLHSSRCMQPVGKTETDTFRDGIELGRYGEAKAYWFTAAHPADPLASFDKRTSHRVAKYDADGTRRVLHYFTPKSPGEIRGRSLLTPLVKKLRQLVKYDEKELEAATLNAILAAFIETDANHSVIERLLGEGIDDGNAGQDLVASYFDVLRATSDAHYEAHPQDIEGVRVLQTAIGEKVSFPPPSRPSSGYDKFEMAALRNFASLMGISLEMLIGDYSKLSYSGWRGALTNVWRGVTCERSGFEALWVRPWFRVVIEEGIARGKILVPSGAPSFWERPAAYLAGTWLGPGRGSADPYKDARADEVELGLGTKTIRKILAERGEDYDAHMDQLEVEIKDFERRGLTHSATKATPTIEAALMADDGQSAEDDEKEGAENE